MSPGVNKYRPFYRILKSKEPPQTFAKKILVAYICYFKELHQPNPCQKPKKNPETEFSYHLWSYELDLWVWLSWHKQAAWNNSLKKFIHWNLARWIVKGKLKLFSNKYCDLLVHASFTKFTGPAKLFINNSFFLSWWSLHWGQLNKSLCGCKKDTSQNMNKLANSVNFLGVHWRCLHNNALQNPKKKKNSTFLWNLP